MRTILIGLAAAGVLLAATPGFGAPRANDAKAASEDGPKGDRWNERWQGRQHYLFDDASAQANAATDGYEESNASGECRKVLVREARPGGASTVRRVTRCD